jgi:hypothetical protein
MAAVTRISEYQDGNVQDSDEGLMYTSCGFGRFCLLAQGIRFLDVLRHRRREHQPQASYGLLGADLLTLTTGVRRRWRGELREVKVDVHIFNIVALLSRLVLVAARRVNVRCVGRDVPWLPVLETKRLLVPRPRAAGE